MTHKVKIHYIGYDSDQDEWRDEAGLVDTSESQPSHQLSPNLSRTSLINQAKPTVFEEGNPEVKLAMNFDKVQFFGGIRQLETLKTEERGVKK